jgi:hypothetical protein
VPRFVPPPKDLLLPVAFIGHGSEILPLIPDGEGTLFELGFSFDPPVAAIAERVRALTTNPHANRVVFVGRGHTAPEAPDPVAPSKTAHPPLLLSEARWSLVAMSGPDAGRPPTVVPLEGDGSFEAFAGWGGRAAHPSFGLVAVQQRGRAWTIHSRHAPIDLHLDPAARVVGVTVDLRAAEEDGACLVVLDGGHRLSLVGRRSSRALLPSPERIVHVTTSPSGWEIAYVTESGTVVVLNTDDVVLARHVPEGG